MERREFLAGVSAAALTAVVASGRTPDDAPYEFDIREGRETHTQKELARVKVKLNGETIGRCVAADPKTGRVVIVGVGPKYPDPPYDAWRRDITYTTVRGRVEAPTDERRQ